MVFLELHLSAVVFGSILVELCPRLVHLLSCSSWYGFLRLAAGHVIFIIFLLIVTFLGFLLCTMTGRKKKLQTTRKYKLS